MKAPVAGLLLGWACGDPGAAEHSRVEGDYRGPVGSRIELVPLGQPEATPRMLQMEAESWELRQGQRWREADTLALWAVSRQDGLWVDESQLLPANIELGSAGRGVSVVDVGERETWYGVFPAVVTVEIEAGRFAGEAAFALNIGPIILTVDGAVLELVGYE
jgi:hypothetical protein